MNALLYSDLVKLLIQTPGERFELSYPCEYALYGKLIPGARPTRLGDPGTLFAKITATSLII